MVERLTDAVWRWTARHPEWHGRGWASEVASFAVRAGGHMLLIDPLVVDAAGWEPLDGVVHGPVETLVTIPYHTRSAEAAAARYGGAIWGHPAVGRRLADPSRLRTIRPGDALPAGVTAHRIGRPVRYEMPLYVPEVRALAFGDAVVGTPKGALGVWLDRPATGARRAWYEERLLPTLRPLAELDVESVLVTHGPPVVRGGRAALAAAFAGAPFLHHA